MVRFIVRTAMLCCVLTITSHDACSTETRVSRTLVTTQFAIPVGVPVAPFAPTYYSYRASQPSSVSLSLTPAQEAQLVERIATKVAERLGSQVQIQPQKVANAPAALPPLPAASAASILESRCARCHGAEKQAGGLDLTLGEAALSRSVRQEILLRVLSTDPGKRMPKNGSPLSESEFMALFRELVH